MLYQPTELMVLDQCPRRYAYREAGWRPKLDGTEAPHAEFGSVFHEIAEKFDDARFHGAGLVEATDLAMKNALRLTWDADDDRPLWGVVVDEWTCTGLKWNDTQTRRTFFCEAARDWWQGKPQVCPKCARPIEARLNLINNHPSKNRLSLLRAVLTYCDAAEGLQVVALDDGKPALELELTAPSLNLLVHWDRYSTMGDLYLVHERKTTSLYLGKAYWDAYKTNLQIALYDLVAHELGLRCDGVLLEAVQIQAGGVRIARQIFTRGPNQRAETIQELRELIERGQAYRASGYWPRRTTSCAHAAGGKPCEFLSVCGATPEAREGLLQAGFLQEKVDA